MQKLKQTLLEEYGSFADKRIKKLESGHSFIVDGREKGGTGADRKPYGSFCTVFANVVGPGEVHVSLGGNVPTGAPVDAWAQEMGVERSQGSVGFGRPGLGFSVTKDTLERLTELARALRAIVAPGAPSYDEPSYKYASPRTADSLERLARTLERAWSP